MPSYKNTLILVISLAMITSTLAAGDCSNPLLATYSFTALSDGPKAVDGLTFCKTLQSGESCCSAETINAFQTNINTFQNDKIIPIVKERDTLIVETRDQLIPTLTDGLTNLKTSAAAAETFIQAKITAGDTTFADGKPFTLEQSLTLTQALERIATKVTTNIADLKTGLKTLQTARSTCMTELLKLQASAWCLACDPNYATNGLTTGSTTITVAASVCTRLQTACYNYISESVTQSNIILAKEISGKLTEAKAALDKISTGEGDATGLDDLATAVQAIEDAASSDSSEAAVQTPASCTSESNCNWICATLFPSSTGGKVDEDVAALGGDVNTEITVPESGSGGSGRILLDGGRRDLAANEWAPDADESGVTITFPEDPAEVNQDETGNTNSAPKLVSGLFCLVSALFGYLLF